MPPAEGVEGPVAVSSTELLSLYCPEQAAQAVKLHKMVSQRSETGGPDLPLVPVQGPDYFKTIDQADGLTCVEVVDTMSIVSALTESRESIKVCHRVVHGAR